MIIVAPKKHIDWETQAGTIYEGEINFLTGEITVVNGSEGAGTYNIAPIPLSASEGVNNIFADCGDVEVTYNISIDEAIQRAIANLGAIGVPYNNSQSGLTATNVQDAIDELAGT